jgi:elongation factor G
MSVQSLRDRLGANPLVLQLPLGTEERLKGVIDLVRMKAIVFTDSDKGSNFEIVEIPAEYVEAAQAAHTKMIESVSELDDALMSKYLDNQPITELELRAAIRKGTIALKVFPVLCGSAKQHRGVQPLLDAVVDYLPCPLDVPPVHGLDKEGNDVVRETKDDAPFSALAFKIMNDSYGTLTFIRVYSGKLESGTAVWNTAKKKRERVGRLVQMRADKRDEIDECCAGDICAIVGLKLATTGDTLCVESHPVLLEKIEFPEPVIQLALEPRSTEDADKLVLALQKLSVEDPSFRVRTDEETGQTIIAGMGELHLEIIVDRLKREFKVDANVGKPQVAYRETIMKKVTDIEGRFVRQSGGHGQFGHVRIDLEPAERGAGFIFENDVVGGIIPKEFIPSIEKGIREAMGRGVLIGYPLVDVKARLFDGSYHEVDSSGPAFEVAASMAFQEGAKRAQLNLLEPMMSVEVVCPENYLGDVIGDLNSRRGRILDMGQRANARVIRAEVPLATMFGYATDVRSKTQGRATHTMQFSHYAPVPLAIQEEIVAKQRG